MTGRLAFLLFLLFCCRFVPISPQAQEAFWMIPVLAASARFNRPETKALEHCPLFCFRIVFFSARAETVLEVMVVMVVRRGFLRVHAPVACVRIGA